MSDPVRLTEFLVRRLSQMGLDVHWCDGDPCAEGELPLGPTPFPTLGEPFVISKALFYTLGHARLKFFAPAPFFDLPALEIGSCRQSAEIESALRRAWSQHQSELRGARAWLSELGASTRTSSHDTRLWLELAGDHTGSAYVRSTNEIALPSGGELARHSLGEPAERRHRPLHDLEHAAELELGLGEQISRAAESARTRRPLVRVSAADPELKMPPRLLALGDNPLDLAAMQATLAARGFAVEPFHDASSALASFQDRSYDLVIAKARMRRVDGLEFTARVQELAGIEKLPVLLVDERCNPAAERAAQVAGASAYLPRPVSWGEVAETLRDMLEGATWRRFVRYLARLPVEIAVSSGVASELTHSIARGGVSIETRRQLEPGEIQRYRVQLPPPLSAVILDGQVVGQIARQGKATSLAGVRIVRFHDEGEPLWIRLIAELASQARRG